MYETYRTGSAFTETEDSFLNLATPKTKNYKELTELVLYLQKLINFSNPNKIHEF